MFRAAQASHTRAVEFIWNEIPVLVTFESNWREAKDLLRHLDPIVDTNVLDDGVNLTIRDLNPDEGNAGTRPAER